MRIGIDIDGVLTDTLKFKLKYGTEYFNVSLEDACTNTYEIRDIFNISREQEKQFVRKYFKEYYCTNNYLRPDAVRVLNEIHEQDNEIIIITGRTEEDISNFNLNMTMKEITECWLKDCGIPYDELYLDINEKSLKVSSLKIDYFIEDLPYFLDEFLNSEYKYCICFDDTYNRYAPYTSMLRVRSWKDLIPIIKMIKENK